MKGRKLLAVLLSAAMGLSLAAPAFAAADADQELMAVTAKVKETLGLDTERFDDFQGHANEDVLLGKRWTLEWSGDGVWLNITADEKGKIYSYNLSETVSDDAVPYRGFGGRLNIPQLPEDKSAAAFETAKTFLGKVLESGVETVELENEYAPSLQQSTYRYNSTVLLNGLESPVRCSVSVRASDLAVIRFWRSDESAGYLGGVPNNSTVRNEGQARGQLRPTVRLEAKYVLEEDGKTALVRYVPVPGDSYYVDSKTGELVNLTELYKKLWEGGGGGRADKNMMLTQAEAAADSLAGGLTQAEKDGAAILAGALSKEDLDRALKGAWPELGLGGYTLSSASYSISKPELPEGTEATPEDYDVSCRLVYSRQEGQLSRNKYVTVEAKTGQLMSVSSRRSYRGEGNDNISYNTTFVTAQPVADRALKTFAATRAPLVALAESVDARAENVWEHLFTYQHTDGTWFFPGNYYTIGVDATDGTISRVDSAFDDDVVLVPPKDGKVVTADQAADVYVAAMAVPHTYLEVPVSINLAGDQLMPLLKEAGYSYVMALKNGFTLSQPKDGYVEGVYAESGQAIVRSNSQAEEPSGLRYDDLGGHWVKEAAEALAVFGIGLGGGSLKPADQLKQLDMIALLSSVDGYSYDPTTATKEETDWLYNHAYSLGICTPETRDPDKAITRGELVKLILDAAGYERVAALPGIFRCSFSDSASLGDANMGYAALAQGLGLVKGGSDGAYAPQREATRAEAVAMLYQYMK